MDAPVAQEAIDTFRAITEASVEDATFYLRASDCNMEIAVNHFFGGMQERVSLRHHSSTESTAPTAPPAAKPAQPLPAKAQPVAPPRRQRTADLALDGAAAPDDDDSDDEPLAAVVSRKAARAPAKAPAKSSTKAKAPLAKPAAKAPAASKSKSAPALAGAKGKPASSATKAKSASSATKKGAKSADAGKKTSTKKKSKRRSPSTSSGDSEAALDRRVAQVVEKQTQQACAAKLKEVYMSLRSEIGHKLKTTPNTVIPAGVIDCIVHSVETPRWGSVEDFQDIFASRMAKYGIPVITAYRRVRAEFLEDQYEPTEDERAAIGGADTWTAIELPTLSGLKPAPPEREVLMRLADDAAADNSDVDGDSSDASSDGDDDASVSSGDALTVSSTDSAEPVSRRGPRTEAASGPRRATVQRTLDGKTIVPPAPKPSAKKSRAAAASSAQQAPAPAAVGGVIRPKRAASRAGPTDAQRKLVDDFTARMNKVNAQFSQLPVRREAESTVPRVQIFSGEFKVSPKCLPTAARDALARAFRPEAPVQNFEHLAAALSMCCPHCTDIRFLTTGRREVIRFGMQHLHNIQVADLKVTAKGQAPDATHTRSVWNRSYDDSFMGEDCADPMHRLLVYLLAGGLRSHVTFRNPVVSDSGVTGELVIQLEVRRPGRTEEDLHTNQLVRETFDALLDRFLPACEERARGVYPYMSWTTILGWRALAAGECATPADLLRLAERSTSEAALDGELIGADVPGITLALKRHQRHSVSLMLQRERRGHSDSIAVPVPTGATLHLNFLAGQLTYEGLGWPAEMPPPACTVRGGILADEMGLGKTLAVMSLAQLNPRPAAEVGTMIPAPAYFEDTWQLGYTYSVEPAKRIGPDVLQQRMRRTALRAIKATLIVVPVSITGQWMAEIARCSPSSRVLLFHGPTRNAFCKADFDEADYVVTTYETLNSTLQLEGSLAYATYDAIVQDELRDAIDAVRTVGTAERTQRERLLRSQGRDKVAAARDAGVPLYQAQELAETVLDPQQRARHNSHIYRQLCEANVADVRITDIHFHRVVFDECQKASNASFGNELHASHVWATSGTPVDSSVAPLRQLCGIIGWNIVGPHAIFSNSNGFGANGNDHAKLRTVMSAGTSWHSDVNIYRSLSGRNVEFAGEGSFAPVPGFPSEPVKASSMWAWAFVASKHIIRHSKSAAVTEEMGLPPRHIEAHVVTPTEDEKLLYAEIEATVCDEIKGLVVRGRMGSHAGTMLQRIDLLRRAAAHPSLVSQSRADGGQAAAAAASMAQELERAGSSDAAVAQAEEAAVAAGVSRGYLNENKKFGITPVPVARVLEQLKAKAGTPTSTIALLEAMCKVPPEVGDCSVCLDRVQLPTLMPCGHCYCRECVLRVVSEALRGGTAKRCPDCRGSIEKGLRQLVLEEAKGGPSSEEQEKEREQKLQRIKHGSKVTYMIELIKRTRREDPEAKFVIFSTFPALMRIAATALAEASVTHCLIDGATSLPRRNALIRNFQGGETVACVISSRVGNAGLTLTAANHLILLEPNLNVAVDAQAMGRIHRFGQTREVTIHRIVAADTAEQRIQVLVDSGRLDVQDQAVGAMQSRAQMTTATSKLGVEQMQYIMLGDRFEEVRADAARAQAMNDQDD